MIDVQNLAMIVGYVLFGIGVLAFVVALVVQVIKEMPWLKRIPTSLVALVVSIALCVLAVIMLCYYLKIPLFWMYFVGAIIAAFVVYTVATSGWEQVDSIWNRVKYNKK